MFYQITFVGEVMTTEWFLALVFPRFTVTDHMMVKLTFEWKTSFAGFALILSIIMDILVQGVGTGCVEELFACFAL